MNKVLKSRSWLSIAEGAEYLSGLLDKKENVTAASILQLGAEGRIDLSVRFVNQAFARGGEEVDYYQMNEVSATEREAEIKRRLALDSSMTEAVAYDFRILGIGRAFQPDGTVRAVEGVYDLAMIGWEKVWVSHALQDAIDGAAAWPGYGPFVIRASDGRLLEVLDHDWTTGKHKFLDAEVPESAELVVRPAALDAFVKGAGSSRPGDNDRPFGSRERNTLYNMIGALLDALISGDEGSAGNAPYPHKQAVIDELLTRISNRGVSKPGITRTTLGEILPKAQKAFADPN